MKIKLNRGLRLFQTVDNQMLRWLIFDTYATFYPITDPHRSIQVSTHAEPELHFDSDRCLFVK